MARYGYACINSTLRDEDVRTNKDMKKATFEGDDDLEYTAELCIRNLKGLLEVLEWNIQHDIKVFRITSMPFPWFTEWRIDDLPAVKLAQIHSYAREIRELVNEHDIRLTMHPGHYCCLASPTDSTYQNAVDSLEAHGRFMNLLQLEQSPYNAINIHIGGTYDDKHDTLDRFIERYNELLPCVKNRLVVENDDTASQFSVSDLYLQCKRNSLPITFDYHHHKFNDGGLTTTQARILAAQTWPDDVTPLVHYSESHPDKDRPQAHSEYVDELPDGDFDCIVESKGKEQAVLGAAD